MVEAQAPTKRTRHVDIRYFALLQWSHSGQLKAKAIPTDANISDSLTKATGRIKFQQHADLYMGRSPPSYVPSTSTTSPQVRRIHTFSTIPLPWKPSLLCIINSSVPLVSITRISSMIQHHGRVRGYSTSSSYCNHFLDYYYYYTLVYCSRLVSLTVLARYGT